MNTQTAAPLVLTDRARKVPADDRCPSCQADTKFRRRAMPFGATEEQEFCGRCGHEFTRKEES